MKKETENNNAIYFKSLTIENLNCFKGKHTFNFSEDKDKHTQWTVILGNNNTGKTTILRALAKALENKLFLSQASLFPELEKINYNFYNLNEKNTDNLLIYGYGISRRPGLEHRSRNYYTKKSFDTVTLFNDNRTLINFEEWLNELEQAKIRNKKAIDVLYKIKEILTSEILPDIKDFKFQTTGDFKNYVLFQTDFGWVRFRELGYGYQTTIAWIIDLMKKMFERYPDSENPLKEPAIVLIDEIDLHLHPEWQRKIIKFVGGLFPNTQFIATTHSPLVIQSADKINVIVLQKNGDHINVKHSEFSTFKGWSVEEILSELMELGEKTKSEDYLKFIKQFDNALDNNDKEQAISAYNELDKILPPMTHQRKLLKIQMTSLTTR